MHRTFSFFCQKKLWRVGRKGLKTLTARGLEELFFQLCCCVSFLLWREIGFGLHTYVLRVQYSCDVVLVF